MSSELNAFLNARLDEDEAAARAAHYEGQRWITEEEEVSRWPDDEPVHSADRKVDARHIARHDPARVLREVEAKRAILAEYERVRRALGPDLAGPLLRVVRHLAAVYGDHPDYRKEWAPVAVTVR